MLQHGIIAPRLQIARTIIVIILIISNSLIRELGKDNTQINTNIYLRLHQMVLWIIAFMKIKSSKLTILFLLFNITGTFFMFYSCFKTQASQEAIFEIIYRRHRFLK